MNTHKTYLNQSLNGKIFRLGHPAAFDEIFIYGIYGWSSLNILPLSDCLKCLKSIQHIRNNFAFQEIKMMISLKVICSKQTQLYNNLKYLHKYK